MTSHYSRGQSTSILTFSLASQCKGEGNASKFINIQGLAGIDMKETTYAKKGRLKDDRTMSMSSNVNWIFIDETVSEHSERYHAIINESMPTFLFDQQNIRYRGDGIRTRNLFANNEDMIRLDYNAKDFTKTTAFLGRYLNALIIADVTPVRAIEMGGRNFSTEFTLASDSDLYSGLIFKSPDVLIEENYLGSFKIQKKISKKNIFEIIGYDEEDNADDWLPCCYDGSYGKEILGTRGVSADHLFNCSCYMK